jgi:thymidylate synthase (FAD)
MPIVEMVDHTQDPEKKIATYAAICYDADTSDDALERRMKKLLNLGHLATLRFASATFKVEGISRVCSHQLVRHPHLSYLQESQRYVAQSNGIVYTPGKILENEEVYKDTVRLVRQSHDLYNKLIANGVRKEDARYVLLQGSLTKMYITGNFQAWTDFIRNRTDKSAQQEIRDVAFAIQRHLNSIAPNIFPIKEE